MVKYVNPFTDFGFKKIFGEEASKPLLLDFLNALLPAENKIKSLSFKNNEKSGVTDEARKVIFDIYCESRSGEKFIVEMQKAKQNYFKERTIFYSTFPIREQAEKGVTWDYNLKAVYCVGILDFTFDDYKTEPEKSEVVHTVKLKNQHGKIFYDKLTYVYLEMPNFNKKINELKTRLDQWLYFIKHLEDLQTIPAIFKDKIFTKALQKAAIANYNKDDLLIYENSLKIYRDMKGVLTTAFDEGKIEGILEGENKGEIKLRAKLFDIAKKLKQQKMPIKIIMSTTGLTRNEIESL